MVHAIFYTSNGEKFLLKFQKLFVSFPNKNNCKDGQQQEFFAQDYLKQYETAFTNFLFYSKISDLHLVLEDFCKKRFLLKKYLKNHLKIFFIKLCRFLHTHRKGSSLLLQKLCKSNFHIYQQ